MENTPKPEIELVDLRDTVWDSLLSNALSGATFLEDDSLVPDQFAETNEPAIESTTEHVDFAYGDDSENFANNTEFSDEHSFEILDFNSNSEDGFDF